MRRSAFTLIEVLVAFSLFLVGMLAVTTIATQSQSLTALTITRTKGALLAQEGIESTEAVSYDALPVAAPFEAAHSLSALSADFAPFTRVVTVQYVDGSLNPSQIDHGLKLITSTVTWTAAAHDVSKLPKTYTLTTLRANM